MSQYHPDADPQFVAMHSHYENLSSSLRSALFESASEISPMITPLDSELKEFCYRLWVEGFKIVPINELPATSRNEQVTCDEQSDQTDEEQIEMNVIYRRCGEDWNTWLPSEYKAEQVLAVIYSDAQPKSGHD